MLLKDTFIKLKKYKNSLYFGQYINKKRHGKGRNIIIIIF
jgi:hypothetical protein